MSIETVSLRRGSNGTSGAGEDEPDDESAAEKYAYVGVVLEFCRLVLNDYDLVLTNLRKYLHETFSCRIKRVLDDGTSGGNLLFEIHVPRAKLVSLQIAQTGGALRDELQKRLVTNNIRAALGVDELTVSPDIRSAS